MDEASIERIGQAVVRRGLEGVGEHDLLSGFCEACVDAGLPLASAVTVIDTLHPIWEGRVFLWRNDGVETESVIEYGNSSDGEMHERWMRTSFYHLHSTGQEEVRRCIGKGEPRDFERLDELHEQGHTDYLAMLNRFAADGTIGGMDCIFTHWTTQRPGGFEDDELVALRRLVPLLALALKTASMTQIAKTVLEIYLGRDAGQQVLRGRITRGVSDRIEAVLWFSDLSGFTKISDAAPPEEVIPLLNDYAEVVIAALHQAGGDVLKLIGDGTLAIFRGGDRAEACRSALRAHRAMEVGLAELNARRRAEGRPVTTMRLGLHVGEVFYGNIGSDDRLDFTVVGPAVNEVSRIVSMGRSVDRDLLVSKEFVEALPEEEREAFVSVGRFALRGVRESKHLYTCDPAASMV
jgi:adenylate cyclase